MSPFRLLALSGLLLLSGCLWHVREKTDQVVCELAGHPFDLGPAPLTMPPAKNGSAEQQSSSAPVIPPTDVRTTALMEARRPATVQSSEVVQATALMQAEPDQNELRKRRARFHIPEELPGADAPRIPKQFPPEPQKQQLIDSIYPELPPLPEAPKPLPGPNGKPYTLADLQQLAAANSPTLRQAASDVEAAKGNLIQARAYPNPTVGLEVDPSNDGSTAGVQGFFIDQPIKTGGKLKLASAAAEMDLRNAELALKRARSDLATQVRNAYYALLVAEETVRVNTALARFTDDVYRIQVDIMKLGFGAPYEPAPLRAQAYTARLGLKQAIATYIYSWKQLVATIGLRQLPLAEVAGRIDSAIPYFDYDKVLAHVLRNHTDVLTAGNGIDKARYNLKLAQVTPVPDLDVRVAILKEFALAPQQYVHTVQIGMPLPIWDRNKGNIIAAEAALVRATEEPHRVETALTNNLATAYANYKNNLDALEYYRKFILPDQVRAYRGVYERRDFGDAAGVVFGDVVAAQQTLATNVTTYLTVLGQVWTSVVSVADSLQTDDLFQLAEPRELPPLPDLDCLPPLPCCHPCAPPVTEVTGAPAAPPSQPLPPANTKALPVPKPSTPTQPTRVEADRPTWLPPALPTAGTNVTPTEQPRTRQSDP
jgi:cobalt-zinc-cadmium efflux system outer membrane protein